MLRAHLHWKLKIIMVCDKIFILKTFSAALHGVRLPTQVRNIRIGIHGVMHLSQEEGSSVSLVCKLL